MSKESERIFAQADSELFPVLEEANNSELKRLAEVISQKKSSTITDGRYSPILIATEIQLFGGDSIANAARRHGVGYVDIVKDVAKKLGVKGVQTKSVIEIECLIFNKVINDYKKTLSDKDRLEFESDLERSAQDQASKLTHSVLQGQNSIFPMLLAAGGFFARRGAINAIPVAGQIISAVSLIVSGALLFTSPSYKVTIPCVLFVAMIRARLIAEERMTEVEI